MNKLKGLTGLLGLAALLILLATVATGLGNSSNNAAFAGEGGWKNVTVLYLNDVKGKIEPCG